MPHWYFILPFIVQCFSFDFRPWVCQMNVLTWNVFWNHNLVQNILRKIKKSSKIRQNWKRLIFVFAYSLSVGTKKVFRYRRLCPYLVLGFCEYFLFFPKLNFLIYSATVKANSKRFLLRKIKFHFTVVKGNFTKTFLSSKIDEHDSRQNL